MKAKVLFTILLLGILPCFAQKSFFGLTLGETNLTQAKEILQKQGISFDENETSLYNVNTRFLLSGYSWDNFSFYFGKEEVPFKIASFTMHNVQDKETLFKNLRELLLSKYADFRIVSTGLVQDNTYSYYKLELEGDRLRISLYKSLERSPYEKPYIQLDYEYLEKLPIPPSDEL